jgi:hemerythrin-like metal-binding protein
MGLFHRSGGYAIFISEIDAEHRKLFRLVEELRTARRTRGEVLRAIVSDLQDHFAHEERLMRESRYDALAWHKQQHDGARRQARRFIRRIEQGDRKAVAGMLEYLAGWLESHIPVTDRMMAAYLRNFERRRAA